MEQSDGEDIVFYSIYPIKDLSIDELLDQCMALICDDVIKYLWHNERFNLSKFNNECLVGQVNFGENVEDEWFVVSLLKKITLQFDCVARVWDEDGEILLIEAADCIPYWAQEPELAKNRVYIYKGDVHLIPIAQRPDELTPLVSGTPKVKDAVGVIEVFHKLTRSSEEVQNAISNRILNYPENWDNQKHYQKVKLPLLVAEIFRRQPQVLAAAIHRVVNMDIIDTRKCRAIENFPQKDIVTSGITFTKCLYAMLSSKKIWPPKKSSWNLDSNATREEMLGFKLCYGLEILFSNQKTIDQNPEKSKEFQSYAQNLQKIGYFKDLLPDSAEHKNLMESAYSFFRSNHIINNKINQDSNVIDLLDVMKTISNEDISIEKFNSTVELKESDNDDWLDMNKEKFDDLLRSKFYFDGEENQAKTMNNIESFLNHCSDMKGIEPNSKENEIPDLKDINESINLNMDEFEAMFSNADPDDFIDVEEEESFKEYLVSMEKQLKELNITEKNDPETLLNYLSVGAQESQSGPSKTLLSNLQ